MSISPQHQPVSVEKNEYRHALRSDLQVRAAAAIHLLKHDRSIKPEIALWMVVWGDPRKEDN